MIQHSLNSDQVGLWKRRATKWQQPVQRESAAATEALIKVLMSAQV